MESIEAALNDLKSQEYPNYAATAKKYGVNRSTLSRRHRGVTHARGSHEDHGQLLSNQQSKCLVAYINRLTERGFPPSIRMVRRFAYDISENQPGKNWAARWVKSQVNELASDFLQAIDLSRKKAENPSQFLRYFQQVFTLIYVNLCTNLHSFVRKLMSTTLNLKISTIWTRKASLLAGYRRDEEYSVADI
jgi:hypothetical protein